MGLKISNLQISYINGWFADKLLQISADIEKHLWLVLEIEKYFIWLSIYVSLVKFRIAVLNLPDIRASCTETSTNAGYFDCNRLEFQTILLEMGGYSCLAALIDRPRAHDCARLIALHMCVISAAPNRGIAISEGDFLRLIAGDAQRASGRAIYAGKCGFDCAAE